jgi:hypothetical protein
MRGSRRRRGYLLAGDDRCPFCCCLRHGADLSESSGSDSPGRASGQPLSLHVVLKTALLDAASHGSGEGQGKDPSRQTIGLDRLEGRDSNRSQETPCPAEVPARAGRRGPYGWTENLLGATFKSQPRVRGTLAGRVTCWILLKTEREDFVPTLRETALEQKTPIAVPQGGNPPKVPPKAKCQPPSAKAEQLHRRKYCKNRALMVE